MLAVVVGCLTGGYPAWILSRPQPVDILRGALHLGGTTALRRVLVGVQLGLSILLCVATLIISTQVDYLLTKDLGLDKEQVVVVNGGGYWNRGRERGLEIRRRYRELLSEYPDILAVSGVERPVGANYLGGDSRMAVDGDTIYYRKFEVDYEIVRTLGLELLEGRDFDPALDGNKEWPSASTS